MAANVCNGIFASQQLCFASKIRGYSPVEVCLLPKRFFIFVALVPLLEIPFTTSSDILKILSGLSLFNSGHLILWYRAWYA